MYRKQIVLIMVVVSTRDFRTNQTKYLNRQKSRRARRPKSRVVSRIFPDDGGDTIDAPRDLMKELKNADRVAKLMPAYSNPLIVCSRVVLQQYRFQHFGKEVTTCKNTAVSMTGAEFFESIKETSAR